VLRAQVGVLQVEVDVDRLGRLRGLRRDRAVGGLALGLPVADLQSERLHLHADRPTRAQELLQTPAGLSGLVEAQLRELAALDVLHRLVGTVAGEPEAEHQEVADGQVVLVGLLVAGRRLEELVPVGPVLEHLGPREDDHGLGLLGVARGLRVVEHRGGDRLAVEGVDGGAGQAATRGEQLVHHVGVEVLGHQLLRLARVLDFPEDLVEGPRAGREAELGAAVREDRERHSRALPDRGERLAARVLVTEHLLDGAEGAEGREFLAHLGLSLFRQFSSVVGM